MLKEKFQCGYGIDLDLFFCLFVEVYSLLFLTHDFSLSSKSSDASGRRNFLQNSATLSLMLFRSDPRDVGVNLSPLKRLNLVVNMCLWERLITFDFTCVSCFICILRCGAKNVCSLATGVFM